MISKNRKLVSGLLSALLVGGSAFASDGVEAVKEQGKVAKRQSITKRAAKGVVRLSLRAATLPLRIVGKHVVRPVKRVLNVVDGAIGATLDLAGLGLTVYGMHFLYRFISGVADGSIGVYSVSGEEMSKIFGEVGRVSRKDGISLGNVCSDVGSLG